MDHASENLKYLGRGFEVPEVTTGAHRVLAWGSTRVNRGRRLEFLATLINIIVWKFPVTVLRVLISSN